MKKLEFLTIVMAMAFVQAISLGTNAGFAAPAKTIRVAPAIGQTDITAFSFTITGCGCDLVNKVDPYMKRIYITVPHAMDITQLAPSAITLSTGATINPPVGTILDWSQGPLPFTVTAADGITQDIWNVLVENPGCKKTDVLGFSFTTPVLVGPPQIDKIVNTIGFKVSLSTDLQYLVPQFQLPCGATVWQTDGSPFPGFFDFSSYRCPQILIRAEDAAIAEVWTMCLTIEDLTPPQVTVLSFQAYNCIETIPVQSSEMGRVFLVNTSTINMDATPVPLCTYNLADWTGSGATSVNRLVANRLGSWATVTVVNANTDISTNGLYAGVYRAFAVDNSGNISPVSTQDIQLDITEVEVSNLCELRNQPPVWTFHLTGEVLVTYEEDRSGGNWKFVQDATCGIQIEDRYEALPTNPYQEGTGLVGLKGTLDKSGIQMKFIPIPGSQPIVYSTNNMVTPFALTYDEFIARCYRGFQFESMLITVTTPMLVFDDYEHDPNWLYDNLDLATTTATGNYDWFIQSIFNSTLINTPIPTVPAYYTGIRTNVDWSGLYGLFTPRKAEDINLVSGPVVGFRTSTAAIEDVVPGQTKSISLNLSNEGGAQGTITALFLTNADGSDGFRLVNPPEVPFTIESWANQAITISYTPNAMGEFSTNLMVELSDGATSVIQIKGKTVKIINDLPLCENFNSWGSAVTSFDGWNGLKGLTRRYGTSGYVAAIGDGYAFAINHPAGASGSLVSPGIVVPGGNPIVTFFQGKIFGLNSNSPIKVLVSTDNQASWTEIWTGMISNLNNVYSGPGPWINTEISLLPFAGQTIFIKWESFRPLDQASFYWIIEDICIRQQISSPIISITPQIADFGGVQLGETGTLNVSIKNSGLSILNIKSVVLQGAEFTLTDTNTYPFEVTSNIGDWAFTQGSSGPQINLTVDFNPSGSGFRTGRIIVTYGVGEELTHEILLSGEGLSCYNSADANIGENYAPRQNTWWKYTPAFDQTVTISSCHPNQTVLGTEYSWDTYLFIYDECGGSVIASNDDMDSSCPFNRASSSASVYILAGQTIYFFWPLLFPTAAHSQDGFFFNLIVTGPPEVGIDFAADRLLLTAGESVNFIDLSTGSPNQWLWEFEGAQTATSTEKNPAGIVYPNAGVYLVTLTASNGHNSSTFTKYNFVSVIEPEQQETVKWTDDFTIGGLKSVSTGADNGWTFVDNSGHAMDWQVRNYGISGCLVTEDPMPSTTGSTGYLVLPADEYNCANGNGTSYTVDAFAQSPSIDCSGLDIVILKYQQRFKTCCTDAIMEVQVSNDGGNLWKSYDIRKDRSNNLIIGNPVELMEVNITEMARRNPDIRIRFYWTGSSHYYWMIDDLVITGYTICTDFSTTISGQADLYYGYPPLSGTNLIPTVSGGQPPYSYSWSTGENSETLAVSPTQSTDYYLVVHDIQGCAATAAFSVNVTDVRCGNNLDKVLVCINNKNPHTVCISPNAVPAQLSNGNYLGTCKKSGIPGQPELKVNELQILLYPNPSDSWVNLEISGLETSSVVLTIKDILGRTVQYEKIPAPATELKRTLQLSQKGVYQVVIQTDLETVTQQLVIIR